MIDIQPVQIHIAKKRNDKLDLWLSVFAVSCIVLACLFILIYNTEFKNAASIFLNSIIGIASKFSRKIPDYYENDGESLFWLFPPLVLLILAIVAIFNEIFSIGILQRKIKYKNGKSYVESMVISIIVIALVVSVCTFVGLNPIQDDEIKNIRSRINDFAHEILCENNAFSLPEGDFTKQLFLYRDGSKLLEVKTDTKTSMYLKSYLGLDFYNNKWSELEGDKLIEDETLFSSLESKAFSSSTQLASINQDNAINSTLAIRNMGVCSAYVCYPYETLTADFLDSHVLGDYPYQRTVNACTAYNVEVDSGALVNVYKNAENKGGILGNEDYKLAESNYRDWVYKTYLDVPSEYSELISALIGNAARDLTTYEACYVVANYLENNTRYESQANFITNDDFLTSFISGRVPGDCFHYATAAVLMLRHLNIPARYVEGFVIKNNEVPDSGSIVLDTGNIHAWAEYYEDGIGWIPFETISSIKEQMTLPEWQNFQSSIDGMEIDIGLIVEKDTNEEFEDITDNQESKLPEEITDGKSEQEDVNSNINIFAFVARLIVLLLIILVLLVILRRIIIKTKRDIIIKNSTNKEMVAWLFAWTVDMMKKCGVEINNSPLSWQSGMIFQSVGVNSKRAIEINNEALFSKEEPIEDDIEYMIKYSADVRNNLKSEMNFKERIYHKWISCVL